MALINCPECNKEVSDRAHSCPFCGFPLDEYFAEIEAEKRIEEEVHQKEMQEQEKKELAIEYAKEREFSFLEECRKNYIKIYNIFYWVTILHQTIKRESLEIMLIEF